ncbi:hypothetical protein [Nonomuraea sp. JJY05]|uniref:hypothetical protein n=1 Tax=Nonomuraea sp. JJY05 TaxID=3350255 RepID=UPI00373EDC9E
MKGLWRVGSGCVGRAAAAVSTGRSGGPSELGHELGPEVGPELGPAESSPTGALAVFSVRVGLGAGAEVGILGRGVCLEAGGVVVRRSAFLICAGVVGSAVTEGPNG